MKNNDCKFKDNYKEKEELLKLYNHGVYVFGNIENFNTWKETKNISPGGLRPKDLFHTKPGILQLNDELIRIAHGVLA